jgi:hypothetical protein
MHHYYKEPIASLRLFCDKLIDYAGLFPPASLNLAQAFNNFIMYAQGDYNWMISRFIVPAGKLGELTELMDHVKYPSDIILPLSVLATSAATVEKFRENISSDLLAIEQFKAKFGNRVSCDAMELRLPAEVIESGSTKDISELISYVHTSFENKFASPLTAFYEADLRDDFNSRVVLAAEAISLFNGKKSNAGFKLRTGGIEPAAFPIPEEAAFAMLSALEYNVPMKCTAGLHHPIRHWDESVGCNMHGYLNVFGAGVFAYVCSLDEEETLQILNEEDPYAFHFTEDGMELYDNFAGNEEIEEARKKFMISYGSCSFDEPVDDLKTMELL